MARCDFLLPGNLIKKTCMCVCACGTGGWNTNDVTRVFARMAESSRAKVKEVILSVVGLHTDHYCIDRHDQ